MTPGGTDTANRGFGLKLLRLVATAEPSSLISGDVTEDGANSVYVKTSPIHGLGVFARRTFATGENVLPRTGRAISQDQPLDTAQGEAEQHCALIENGRQIYLDFPTRFINHSCEANAFVADRDGLRQVVALKPIHAHEEVLLHYGVDLNGQTPWKCHCGSESCLRVVPGSFFEMPIEAQIELSPFLSSWFIKENAEAYQAMLEEAGLDGEALSN